MTSDTHALSGAYALDALSPEEAAAFEQHLEGCDPCRAEVSEFREVVARLGARAAETPPATLRERVLTQADRTRQDPPAPVASDQQGATVPPAPSQAGQQDAVVTPMRRRRRWAAGLLAAAVVVTLGGVLGVQAINDEPEQQTPALAQPAAEVFNADDAESVNVRTKNGGTLRVAVSEERGEMAVDTRDLPDPGEGQVYQLWTGHGAEMIDAGALEPGTTGAAMPLPKPGDTVNVTVEPAGGSEQPTSEPIVTVAPTAI